MSNLKSNIEQDFPMQLSAIFRERIVSGTYKTGQSLPSVRKLAQEFGVSPVTVVRAFDLLEPEGLIRRTQGKGCFVTTPENSGEKKLRIAFVFPPERFVPECIGSEEWGLASEFHRGLLAGAAESNAMVSFLQYPYELPESEKESVIQTLESYDIIIFTAHMLTAEVHLLSRKRTVLILNHNGRLKIDDENISLIDYDRKNAVSTLAGFVKKIPGVASVGAVAMKNDVLNGKDRAQRFLNACRENGKTVLPEHYVLLDDDAALRTKQLKNFLTGITPRPQVIFCDYTSLVMELYRISYDCGLTAGVDFKVVSISSGTTLENLLPPSDYVRIPRFEMGYGVVCIVCAALREQRKFILPVFAPELIIRSENF